MGLQATAGHPARGRFFGVAAGLLARRSPLLPVFPTRRHVSDLIRKQLTAYSCGGSAGFSRNSRDSPASLLATKSRICWNRDTYIWCYSRESVNGAAAPCSKFRSGCAKAVKIVAPGRTHRVGASFAGRKCREMKDAWIPVVGTRKYFPRSTNCGSCLQDAVFRTGLEAAAGGADLYWSPVEDAADIVIDAAEACRAVGADTSETQSIVKMNRRTIVHRRFCHARKKSVRGELLKQGLIKRAADTMALITRPCGNSIDIDRGRAEEVRCRAPTDLRNAVAEHGIFAMRLYAR